MKVILVNGSSHKNGTTMAALNEMIKIFAEAGAETEVIQLAESLSRTVCSAIPAPKQENACLTTK